MRVLTCICCQFKVVLSGPFPKDPAPDSRLALGQIDPSECPHCLERVDRLFAGAYENFVGLEPPIPTFSYVAV